jgi:3',5'-cyclic AMP phosphodiesterase CpdA
MPVRLAHFSDVHLTAKPLGFRPRDMMSKRFTGWLNVRMLGRGRSFRHAPAAVAALIRAIKERRPDVLIFSGDATGLGFESEFVAASHALGVRDEEMPPGVAVPGNHDYYTRRGVRDQLFEQYFAPWQTGRRADPEHLYPFARKIGDVWLVCTNSSRPNRWNWDASGDFGSAQLERVRKLCSELDPGPRVLVTHYPLRTATGQVEPRIHRLRDHEAALQTAVECGIDLWLHGHIHHKRDNARAMRTILAQREFGFDNRKGVRPAVPEAGGDGRGSRSPTEFEVKLFAGEPQLTSTRSRSPSTRRAASGSSSASSTRSARRRGRPRATASSSSKTPTATASATSGRLSPRGRTSRCRRSARRRPARRVRPGQRDRGRPRRRLRRRGRRTSGSSRTRTTSPASSRRAAEGFRQPGHARDAQHLPVGARRLALRAARRLHAVEGSAWRVTRGRGGERQSPSGQKDKAPRSTAPRRG